MRVMGTPAFHCESLRGRGCAGWFGRADCGQFEGLAGRGRSVLLASIATRGNVMYIGVGTVVLIILIVLLVLFLRRRA